jgi:hypothetical protein
MVMSIQLGPTERFSGSARRRPPTASRATMAGQRGSLERTTGRGVERATGSIMGSSMMHGGDGVGK